MSAPVQPFPRLYERALGTYVARPDEQTLRPAYELGREAVRLGLGILDLAAAHHDALRAALARRAETLADADRLVSLAGEFAAESLSAFEMVQRGFREVQDAALAERRQAAMLRQLSNFLADASLAPAAPDTLTEMAHLVAEQARELTGADSATVSVAAAGRTVRARSPGDDDSGGGEGPDRRHLSARLTALGGGALGAIEVWRDGADPFTDLQQALLVHLAQMAAATVERARAYP